MRIVLDSNVLVAAARSRRGASYALLSAVPSSAFEICLSNAMYAEWREVLTRPENLAGRTAADVINYLRYLAGISHLQEIYFLWRPNLRDPGDDMVLELAFAAGCSHIVTHNLKDFVGVEQFGIQAISPKEFLKLVRSKI